MTPAGTVKFILRHPLNRDQKLSAFSRYVKWQIGSRLCAYPMLIPFANNTRLIAKTGMTGATGNLYCGLYEFEDMSFLLHALRDIDLFVDIGANIGAYTVLASGAIGARSISIEPIPSTFAQLLDNISLNHLTDKVKALNIGIGEESGTLQFTSTQNTTNHALPEGATASDSILVNVSSLDGITAGQSPVIIKIDVEGFETAVVKGANQTLSSRDLKAVVMESNGSGSQYGFDEEALYQTMLSYGFGSYSYDPYCRRLAAAPTRSIEGNTLYVRDFDFISDRLQSAESYFINGKSI